MKYEISYNYVVRNQLRSICHCCTYAVCVRVCYRLWDIECGACLRVLEGHEELVRCIRFDNKRIVSVAYDGYVVPVVVLFDC